MIWIEKKVGTPELYSFRNRQSKKRIHILYQDFS